MAKQITVCPVAELPPGAVTSRAVLPSETSTADTSRSRGGVDICAQTWRADRSRTGDSLPVAPIRLRRRERTDGPRTPTGFAKIPGLGTTFKMLTKVWPLGRGTVSVSGNDIVVE